MAQKKCSVDGCAGLSISRGLCQSHYRRWMKYGRLDRVRDVNQGKSCASAGCEFTATAKGFCATHYKAIARQNPKNARANKQYALWHDRKSQRLLCAEWLDFFTFVRDIGERPTKRHALMRKHGGLYGPQNFRWKELQSRRPGESKKDWYARKWKSRKAEFPEFDKDRAIHRKYGLSRDDYNKMLKQQNGACAICLGPETRLEPWSGGIKNLAIDHCHATGKVRGLLCSRCNTTIGHIEESIDLLRSMEMYLQRHTNSQLL